MALCNRKVQHTCNSSSWAAADQTPSRKEKQNTEHIVLLESVRSLYADKLEPLDVHVRRRIEELTGDRWKPERLLEVAATIKSIKIEEEKGKHKTRLYLAGRKKDFVDQTSLQDPYPKDMWHALKEFVETHDSDFSTLVQASSRYDIGKMLHDKLPALRSYSLGQVCHVVQLAVKVHDILGYRAGRLVPYRHSLDFEKFNNARGKQPTGVEVTEVVVSSMSELRRLLSKLLADPTYRNGIQISSLKALIRKNFRCELNETVLGFTRLSSLLSDPQISRIGVLETLGSEICFRSARWRNEKRPRCMKKPSVQTSAIGDSTKAVSGTVCQNGLSLSPSSSASMPHPQADNWLASAGEHAWAWAKNSSVEYHDTVVYEPNVCAPTVKCTFIEFPLLEHARGRRRENSCPPRVECGGPMQVTSLISGFKEEDEFVSTMDAFDITLEPMLEPPCTPFSYGGS